MEDRRRREEYRTSTRFRVHFRFTFFAGATFPLEGMGTVIDLSRGGCQIETSVFIPGAVLTDLRISVPDMGEPLMIERAVVRWRKGRIYGVRFTGVQPAEQTRLHQVLACAAKS